MVCYNCGKEIDPANIFEAIDLGDGRGVCTDCDYKIAAAGTAAMADRNIDKP
jgi:DNA-directed RNA polymerase subunit RPC12/RpoP